MTIKTVQATLISEESLQAEICFELGGVPIKIPFTVECPNQGDHEAPHQIEKNGHAMKMKAKSQQYHCKTCDRYFYPQTSRFFTQFQSQIKQKMEHQLMQGNLKSIDLAKLCNWSATSAARVLEQILASVYCHYPDFGFNPGQLRLNIVFMDETFLKIRGKTWYLIMAVSDTGHIIAAELREHRDQETIIPILRAIESQLGLHIPIFATDGLAAYKGAALALNHNLIHVRHIHSPPYGRIEIDGIELLNKPGEVKVTTLETMNDIFKEGGVFLARVKSKTISTLNPPLKRPRRKKGGKNRPKEVILTEKAEKEKNQKTRGRPKKTPSAPVYIFKVDKEKGRIQPWGEGGQDAANILTSLYHAFGQKCITTNLIEKEFSALKILICFRGRRSLGRWKLLLHGYCRIRNNPFLLKSVLHTTSISMHGKRKAMARLPVLEVCA